LFKQLFCLCGQSKQLYSSVGAFHSTKNSRPFETLATGTGIFLKSFRKIRKLLNFRNAPYSARDSGDNEKENKTKQKTKNKQMGRKSPATIFQNGAARTSGI